MNTSRVNKSMTYKAQRARAEERRKKVAANLLAGLTYRQMAETFDVALGTIAKDVKIILGRWRSEQVEDINDWVSLELTRLDRALNAVWDKVLEGDARAGDLYLRYAQHRAKLLGLYAPDRMELSGPDGGPVRKNVQLDLSQLTEEQLIALVTIADTLYGGAGEE